MTLGLDLLDDGEEQFRRLELRATCKIINGFDAHLCKFSLRLVAFVPRCVFKEDNWLFITIHVLLVQPVADLVCVKSIGQQHVFLKAMLPRYANGCLHRLRAGQIRMDRVIVLLAGPFSGLDRPTAKP